MIITTIRHTSVDVPSGICYGITDVPLAPAFRNESESIRQKLADKKFDAVFSSPLSRCTKLAAELFPEGQLRIDHRLTELNFGDWEMTSWKSIYESETGKEWFANYVNTRCPNGESFIDLIHRAKLFLNDLKRNDLSNIVIFTHAGIIRAMMCLLQDKTPEEAFDTPLEYGEMITFNLGNE
jgi:alpha-ribazole phosphatase